MREKEHPVSLGLVLGQTTDRLYQVISKNLSKIHVTSTNDGFRCRSRSIRHRTYFVLCDQAVLRLVCLGFSLLQKQRLRDPGQRPHLRVILLQSAHGHSPNNRRDCLTAKGSGISTGICAVQCPKRGIATYSTSICWRRKSSRALRTIHGCTTCISLRCSLHTCSVSSYMQKLCVVGYITHYSTNKSILQCALQHQKRPQDITADVLTMTTH